jgi:hypothetical protein
MFNANDWFQKNNEIANGKPQVQPFAVNHQWAASIGGPIVKNKLFFYVDQEGLYYALPSLQHVFLPTPAFRTAILNNITTNQPAQVDFYTNLMNLYANSPANSALAPIPNDPNQGCGPGFNAIAGFGAGGAPCTEVALFQGVNHNKEWLLTERIDYNMSNSDKLFGRFKVDRGSQPTSTDLIDRAVFSTQSIQPEYEGQINYTHVFSPTVVNNAILSGLWYTAVFLPDSGQAAVLAATGGYSTISVGGGAAITNIGGGTGAGQVPDFVFPQGRNSAMGQLTDDFSITHGNHTFKMGLNFRRDILIDFDQLSGGQTLAQILAGNAFFSPPNYTSIANQINNPKYLEWNFEIQQAFGSKMTLNLNYVGTHGYDNLIQNANLNASSFGGAQFAQAPQGFFSCALTGGASGCTTGVALSGTDARFGAVRELQSVGISNYDGLVATFTRRFTHGFQGSVNYTWSHSLDDLTSTNPGTPFNALYSAVYQINPNCLRCLNYSNGDGDARHNITANYVWDIPFNSQNRLLKEVAGGWMIAGTVYAHSGLPWTPLISQAPAFQFPTAVIGIPFIITDFNGGPTTCQVSGPGPATTNTCVNVNNFPSVASGTPNSDWGNIRRNSFRGLGYFDTNLNVNKSFSITEHTKFELGGSFFNILNHPNFALPNPYVQGITGPFAAMTSLAVQPTTPYGAFQGAGVEGRLIQVHGKITF